MTRKLNRDYSLSVVVPFIAILVLTIAAAALAQTSGAGQTAGKADAVLALAGASASAQAERPLTPWTGNTSSPPGRPQTRRHGAHPLDAYPLLFMPVVSYGSGGFEAWSVVVADVNGDGKPDLVVSNNEWLADGKVGVLLGNGDGTFHPVVTYDSGGYIATSVAVADVNGDGKPDLVVANWCHPLDYYGECVPPGAVSVLLGNGDGTFQPAVTYDSGAYGAGSLAIADVNGDGRPDLVVANANPGTVDVLLGNGDGTFQPAVGYGSGGGASGVVIADVNGDGKPDIVVANGGAGVLLGNGDGTFQPVVTYGTGGGSNAVAVADVNGDGKPDLLAANYDEDTVGVLLGNGDGTFRPVVDYYAGGGGYCPSVTAGDVNGDGSLDLLAANPGGAGMLLGNGDGTFQSVVTYSSDGSSPWSVAVADVNGDGKPDVVVANLESGNLGVLLNNSGAPPTTTSLVSSVNPVDLKQGMTYTATVTLQSGGTLTGTVMFQDGGSTIANVTLADNEAAYSTSYKSVGAHAITATYSGVLHAAAGSTSNTLTEYVRDATSKTAVTTSDSPSLFGQPVRFTATVTSTYGKIPDGEVVTFYDFSTAIGTGTTVGGAATLTTTSLTVKTHIIKAAYPGDDSFEPSTGSVKQVVDKYPTTTALSSSLNPSNYGQAVTLTATVTSAGPTPTGKVSFKNGSKTLAVGTLNASGVASLTTAKLPVGANTLTATYNGDAFNGNSASAAITQTVSQASINMVLTSTPNPSTFGKSVHFTATLTSNGGVPSGQPVTFSHNGATLGTANVNSKGVATFSTTTLPQGSDEVTAAYAGTVDYSSASGSVTQLVN